MPGASRGSSAHASPPAARSTGGCLIAAIVVAVAAIAMLGLLAAIALPQYQDYTRRAKAVGFVQQRATALRAGIEGARPVLGRCPETAAEAALPEALAEGVRLGARGDACTFELRLSGVDRDLDGLAIEYLLHPGGGMDCTGGDLPVRYRPANCRTTLETPR